MYPAVAGNDFQQTLAVGRVQLCKRAVLQNHFNDRVLIAQAFKHLGVCAVAAFCFLFDGKPQILKQHLAQLLRGIDIEFSSRALIYLFLKL